MQHPQFHDPQPVLSPIPAHIRAESCKRLMDDHASRAFRHLTEHFRIGSFDDKCRMIPMQYLHEAASGYRRAKAQMEER